MIAALESVTAQHTANFPKRPKELSPQVDTACSSYVQFLSARCTNHSTSKHSATLQKDTAFVCELRQTESQTQLLREAEGLPLRPRIQELTALYESSPEGGPDGVGLTRVWGIQEARRRRPFGATEGATAIWVRHSQHRSIDAVRFHSEPVSSELATKPIRVIR